MKLVLTRSAALILHLLVQYLHVHSCVQVAMCQCMYMCTYVMAVYLRNYRQDDVLVGASGSAHGEGRTL